MKNCFQKVKVFLGWQSEVTSGLLFRLHSSLTAAVLMAMCLVMTASHYVGTPIHCVYGGNKDLLKSITSFCFVTSTFTFADGPTRLAENYKDVNANAGRYHNYHQWVIFALFLQAMMCYFPKYLWNMWERGLLKAISLGMTESSMDAEEKARKKEILLRYLDINTQTHNIYAISYWFCETLCLVNVTIQMYFMEKVFKGQFTHGLRVWQYIQQILEDRQDPMMNFFPHVTKCTFYKYGITGIIQRHEALCTLPLNEINEKIYFFISVWFTLLVVLLSLLMLHRIVEVFCPGIRLRVLLLVNKKIPCDVAYILVCNLDIGDWWILYILAKNMDSTLHAEVAAELAHSILAADED